MYALDPGWSCIAYHDCNKQAAAYASIRRLFAQVPMEVRLPVTSLSFSARNSYKTWTERQTANQLNKKPVPNK